MSSRLVRPSSRALASSLRRPLTAARPSSRSRVYSIMADQKVVFTANAPTPLGPYSQAIKTPTTIYCSGQIPLTPDGKMVEGSIAEKTTQCCKNLEAVLTEAGSSLRKVVKLTIFLSDMAHFAVSPEMNSTCEKFFPHKPARSCVAAKTLPKNVDVEIEAVALP
ncbi:hypothetical protein CDD80_2343 [Ophiocordyceps camponoti-rufipedis]|uniref:Uncharacterized protein n=1 Tax=Ophiocordyceps camponoti-rufipedis TaxID=2004952 RepID=A0A2C5Z6J2_9HYPO|nr:hypothetical protein CDD80_2343 [Ophiocordyceps camponoti-rufipedis]